MSTYEFSVPCLFGLEGIAGDELRRLDIPNVRVENGRVLFSGEARDMAKANICLRTGERVLIVLADFPAKTFEELFQGVYHANLEDFIPKDGSFPVKGHCLNSQLMSVPDCQAIVKKAVSRRLGEKYGVSWLPETGAKYQLQFSIMNDRVQLYLDTSGQGLHAGMRRGKGVDDFGGTDGQDLDLGICRKRGLDTIENNLGLLVSAHNVNTNANVTHFICSLYKNGRLIEPAIVVPVGTASHPEYTVTR